jgi:large subunit ribosomal protein L30
MKSPVSTPRRIRGEIVLTGLRSSVPTPSKRKATRSKKARRKTIRLKQIRSSVGKPREVREAVKALGLGKLYQFVELPDTKEVRGLMAKANYMLSKLDGPDILFPLEKSTLGDERIRDVVEAVRAESIRAGRK